MFKFLSVLAVLVLTACTSSKDADSTAVTADSATVVADSVAVDSTITAKTDSTK